MRIGIAAAVFALALPALAQDPAAAESTFYKAYYLEKGERDFAQAMALYDKFLAAAPEHRLAKVAAQQQLSLLQRTGKSKEAEVFATKWEKVIGRSGAPVAVDGDKPAAEGGARGGEARADGGADAAPARARTAERLSQLKEELAKAKESGDEAKAKQLEDQIKRMETPGTPGARGQGGQGGGQNGQGGQGRRGAFGQPVKKFAEMSKDEMEQFKTQRLEGMSRMVDRIRQGQGDEAAKKIEDGVAEVKKALDAGKIEDAQKAWDKLQENMPRRRGGGGF
ncbi:MAG TPA: hypothetical protein VK348_01630 [Planctomycetota bacterium]|nr:hypothetical protein [Planctomycetota bacterium]